MTEELKQLVRNTWSEYFSGGQQECINRVDKELVKDYELAMKRLETDFEFQTELGIGN